mmetsp:Transcript_35987/g.115609  ORF Transcript_35987/g.115609 Transcript_35987/m.115609 type:complete len:225 (+) Transcript_35987:62-736(+)
MRAWRRSESSAQSSGGTSPSAAGVASWPRVPSVSPRGGCSGTGTSATRSAAFPPAPPEEQTPPLFGCCFGTAPLSCPRSATGGRTRSKLHSYAPCKRTPPARSRPTRSPRSQLPPASARRSALLLWLPSAPTPHRSNGWAPRWAARSQSSSAGTTTPAGPTPPPPSTPTACSTSWRSGRSRWRRRSPSRTSIPRGASTPGARRSRSITTSTVAASGAWRRTGRR